MFSGNTNAPDTIIFNLNVFVKCSKIMCKAVLSTVCIPRQICLALAVDWSTLLISLNFMEVTAVSCQVQSQLVLFQFAAVFCAVG